MKTKYPERGHKIKEMSRLIDKGIVPIVDKRYQDNSSKLRRTSWKVEITKKADNPLRIILYFRIVLNFSPLVISAR